MNDRIASLLRPELRDLAAYVPHARPGIEVRLDANEAPENPSPRVREAIASAARSLPIERYPDPQALALKSAIAAISGARVDELLVGSGSDEVISLILTAFARAREGVPQPTLLTPTPTFVMYRVTARGHGWKVVEVPLDASWDLDVAGMKRAIEFMRPNVVFVASPNNPTGNTMSEARMAALIEASPDALVVVDEAYVDFSTASLSSWRARYSNLAILRTLSKVGLASLRVGWLEAAPQVIAALDKVRQPFNLSALSQRAAQAVISRAWQDVTAHVDAIKRERARVSDRVAATGCVVTQSDANFVWVRTPVPAELAFEGLAARGILVRSFHSVGGRLANQLRISIGSEADNSRMLEALQSCVLG